MRSPRVIVFAVLSALLSACGEERPPAVDSSNAEALALVELGEMYMMHSKRTSKPPDSGKPLMKYMMGFSHGSMAIQNKTVGVYWGAPVEKGSTAVLAYDAETPKTGGSVLLQDGQTVKNMTPEEFNVAPKAPGTLEEPAPLKGNPKSGRQSAKNGR